MKVAQEMGNDKVALLKGQIMIFNPNMNVLSLLMDICSPFSREEESVKNAGRQLEAALQACGSSTRPRWNSGPSSTCVQPKTEMQHNRLGDLGIGTLGSTAFAAVPLEQRAHPTRGVVIALKFCSENYYYCSLGAQGSAQCWQCLIGTGLDMPSWLMHDQPRQKWHGVHPISGALII